MKSFLTNDVVRVASGGPLLIIVPTPPRRPAGCVACAPYPGERSKWSWYHGLNLVLVPKEQIDSISKGNRRGLPPPRV